MGELSVMACPEKGDSRFLSLSRLTFDSPGVLSISTGDQEHVMDILAGVCALVVDPLGRKTFQIERVGGRPDIFSGKPEYVYIPPHVDYEVRCIRAPFEAVIYSAPTDESGDPVHVQADQVKAVASGASDWQRDVYIGMGEEGPATRMMVGETESPPGNWSGFPPHRHSEDKPPLELALEELYYFKLDPNSGFVIGGIYHDPSNREGSAELRMIADSRFFDVPSGYHFIAPCPGYRVRYTWALGGNRKGFGKWKNDPDYTWLSQLHQEKR
jgi:5-deoxy-glucuronate isomerase